jgi:protein-S-isoprenylcysteine O-methyltransferase Ste14
MHWYDFVIVIGGLVLWLTPFFLTGWGDSTLQRIDRRARWGMLLEFGAVGLMLASCLWAGPPQPWRVVASVVWFGLATLLSATATRALGRHLRFDAAIGTEHELVRQGPYRLVRHPIYTSVLCALWGIGFMGASPLLFGVATVACLAGTEIRVWTEDRLLAARFGEQFREYRRSTRAYVPFLR